MRIPEHSALRSSSYRGWLVLHAISLTGVWAQVLAESWLAYRLTGSMLVLGAIAFASQAPTLVLGPLGGFLADRFDGRRLVALTQTGSALQAAGLALFYFLGGTQIWILALMATWQGCVAALDSPCRQSFVFRMVGDKSRFASCIALNAATFNGARLVGSAVAGVVIATAGEGACFLFNALSFLPVLLALRWLPAAPHARHPNPASFGEALLYVRRHSQISGIVVTMGAASLLLSPYAALLSAFGKDVLGGGADVAGLLTGACALGALCSSVVVFPWVKGHWSLPETVRRSLVASVLCAAGLGFCHHLGVALVLLFALSMSLASAMVSASIVIQGEIEDRMRGTVTAVFMMCIMGTLPFGALLMSGLAHLLGLPGALFVCAVAMGGVVLAQHASALPRLHKAVTIAG